MKEKKFIYLHQIKSIIEQNMTKHVKLLKKALRFTLNCLFNSFYSVFLSEKYWVSNYFLIPQNSKYFKAMFFFYRDSDIQEMKAFYQAQGYLYIKGMIDKEKMILLHTECAKIFQKNTPKSAFTEIQNLPVFCDIVRDSYWENEIKRIMGLTCFTYKRKVIRLKKTFSPQSTGVHYDKTYLRKSKGEFFNIWMPINDIPVGGGSIAYLNNSVKIGNEIENMHIKETELLTNDKKFSAYSNSSKPNGWLSKNLIKTARKYNSFWLINDFESGDVVIHSPYILHSSFANYEKDKVSRLSIDIRLQVVDSVIDDRWLENWRQNDNL
jgi:hypothetical protein